MDHKHPLIATISEISIQQIGNLIDNYLVQVDDRLLGLAERVDSNDQQNQVFETKATLRQHHNTIAEHFRSYLQDQFNQPISAQPQSRNFQDESLDNLELIDISDFEDWLSIEVIVRRADERFYKDLQCLQQRFSQLYQQELTRDQLPIAAQHLCLALQAAIKNLNIPRQLQPTLFRFYDELVIGQLQDIYDAINTKLKGSGILPKLESQILLHERPLHSQPKSDSVIGFTEHANDNQDTDNTTDSTETYQQPANLYAAVKDILNLLQPSFIASGERAERAQPETELTSIEDIISDLSSLQIDPASIEAAENKSLIGTWLQQNQNITLSRELANLLQLVTTIFDNINQNVHISTPLLAQLKRLEIPIAKQALLDTNFFTQDHSAKQLINLLVELSANSETPNPALEHKLDEIINDINSDTSDFKQALLELNTVTEYQQKAYDRNSERVAQTYQGRQKLQQAQDAITREIQRRISPPEAPELALELLDCGWKELLKLTYIKQGPNSATWHKHLASLDELLHWINALEEGCDEVNIHKKLEADSFSDLLAQELNSISPGDFRYRDTIEKIRSTLKGELPIKTIALTAEDEAGIHLNHELEKELEAANPELIRWFKRAKSLQIGDELGQLDDDTGLHNIKLAWVSDNKQHFVFVNKRGQKIQDYDLVDLARALASGLAPINKQADWPLVERSLYSSVQQAYEQLAFKSCHDELTGLINRKECERLINEMLTETKTQGHQHALLYIDIDGFSLINDLHGHLAGDNILIELSSLLADANIDGATIGRMAGNEFIVILPRKNNKEAYKIAEGLRVLINDHKFSWETHSISLTSSIGLIEINKYTSNTVDLLRDVVGACQSAKKSTGDRVVEFQQDEESHIRREKLLSWIDKLNSILNSDKFVLRGQKIAALHNGTNDNHYEILLGIKNEKGELESPIEFIEAAECYNRMQRVDRWVVENTFKWLSSMMETRQPIPSVSLNLSGNTLNDDLFMEFIFEQFAKYKVPTKKVCFEVTETATINNLAEAADFIREIKKLGCKFSLDDFGSGNASYQYLRHLPVDYLKIDGMFVKGIDKNQDDYALVKSINEIAHLMGKETIAEYAESDTIIEQLREIGVDYIQGYAISKPTPLTNLHF